jgi:hypothetical protein
MKTTTLNTQWKIETNNNYLFFRSIIFVLIYSLKIYPVGSKILQRFKHQFFQIIQFSNYPSEINKMKNYKLYCVYRPEGKPFDPVANSARGPASRTAHAAPRPQPRPGPAIDPPT